MFKAIFRLSCLVAVLTPMGTFGIVAYQEGFNSGINTFVAFLFRTLLTLANLIVLSRVLRNFSMTIEVISELLEDTFPSTEAPVRISLRRLRQAVGSVSSRTLPQIQPKTLEQVALLFILFAAYVSIDALVSYSFPSAVVNISSGFLGRGVIDFVDATFIGKVIFRTSSAFLLFCYIQSALSYYRANSSGDDSADSGYVLSGLADYFLSFLPSTLRYRIINLLDDFEDRVKAKILPRRYQVTCGLCANTFTRRQTVLIKPCGHRTCKSCFLSFLQGKVDEAETLKSTSDDNSDQFDETLLANFSLNCPLKRRGSYIIRGQRCRPLDFTLIESVLRSHLASLSQKNVSTTDSAYYEVQDLLANLDELVFQKSLLSMKDVFKCPSVGCSNAQFSSRPLNEASFVLQNNAYDRTIQRINRQKRRRRRTSERKGSMFGNSRLFRRRSTKEPTSLGSIVKISPSPSGYSSSKKRHSRVFRRSKERSIHYEVERYRKVGGRDIRRFKCKECGLHCCVLCKKNWYHTIELTHDGKSCEEFEVLTKTRNS